MTGSRYNLLVILGPTASGKTKLATQVASKLSNSEIISADSRQIYKRMDIGTGKDLDDYIIDGLSIPYHLIDIREPGYKYNVYEYQNDFYNAFSSITSENKNAILCGGTGLYIESVLKNYKLIHVPPNMELREELNSKSLEELEAILTSFRNLHNSTDTETKKRAIRAIEIETYYQSHPEISVEVPIINPLIIGIDINRERRRTKITKRLHERLKEGMIDEVKGLLDEGILPEDLIYYGLEYKFITQYIIGEIGYEEMVEKLNIAIHQFAKRQMTWFRGMEKRGVMINWLKEENPLESNSLEVINLFQKGQKGD